MEKQFRSREEALKALEIDVANSIKEDPDLADDLKAWAAARAEAIKNDDYLQTLEEFDQYQALYKKQFGKEFPDPVCGLEEAIERMKNSLESGQAFPGYKTDPDVLY